MNQLHLKALLATVILVASLAGTYVTYAQSSTFYVCAGYNFKLSGPSGYDEYEWSADDVVIAGADSAALPVEATDASAIGSAFLLKTYKLRVKETAGCWSEEGVFSVNILPQMSVSVDGTAPPYCESAPQSITLTASVNGAAGSTALSLPDGMGIAYEWSAASGAFPDGNAEVEDGATSAIATVMTPNNTAVDNKYKVKVSYTYPDGVNVLTDVVGNCGDEHTESIHAEPVPATPGINYEHL